MPRKYIKRPPRNLLHLPVSAWPEVDQKLFARVFETTGNIFSENNGAGTHLRRRTIESIRFAWRRWLGWLARTRPDLLSLPVEQRLTPELVKAFVRHLQETNQTMAVAASMRFFYDAARYMLPDQDWLWLRTLTNKLSAIAKAKPRPPIAITSDRLVNIGMEMMDEAESLQKTPRLTHHQLRKIANLHRDGLMISLEALLPLRRTSLASMRIGTSLRRAGDVWVIDIDPVYVKNSQRIRATLPPWLAERLDVHIREFRPLFRASHSHQGVWASEKGGPLQGDALYIVFKKRLRQREDLCLSLHDVRRVGATTWAIEDPVTVGGVKDLLGDKSAEVVAKHYICAGSLQASRQMAQLIRKARLTVA